VLLFGRTPSKERTMNGGLRIRKAALCALAAAALAGGACTQSTTGAHVRPAAGAGGVIVNAPAPDMSDTAVTDAPGGITDGHGAEDLPATTIAPQPVAPGDPATGPAADGTYASVD
jgi:hypothetical protein